MLLFDMDGLEVASAVVASAVDEYEGMDKEIFSAYFETISDLKDRIMKRKDC